MGLPSTHEEVDALAIHVYASVANGSIPLPIADRMLAALMLVLRNMEIAKGKKMGPMIVVKK